jgi:NADH-quinone oxidoreductase subunit H
MQDRIGANRAALPFIPNVPILRILRVGFGTWHNLADAVKMLTKENFKPKIDDRFIYNLAIWLAVIPALMSAAVVPIMGPIAPGKLLDIEPIASIFPGLVAGLKSFFGDRVYTAAIADLDVGVLFIFAITGLGIFGSVLAGWASNNKFALMGGLRGAAQMVSYEIPLGLSLMGLILIYGTLNVAQMVEYQGAHYFFGGWVPAWGVVVQPLAFFLFFAAAIAENKRIPFDLPEAESEIVAGYFTEYSGMKMGLFMLSEFIHIAVNAMLITTFFFGGYQIPFLYAEGFRFPWGESVALPMLAVLVLQHVAFLVKVVFFCWFQILIRWTLPRFRYDQLMHLGWKSLLPLSLINLLVTAIVLALMGVKG